MSEGTPVDNIMYTIWLPDGTNLYNKFMNGEIVNDKCQARFLFGNLDVAYRQFLKEKERHRLEKLPCKYGRHLMRVKTTGLMHDERGNWPFQYVTKIL